MARPEVTPSGQDDLVGGAIGGLVGLGIFFLAFVVKWLIGLLA